MTPSAPRPNDRWRVALAVVLVWGLASPAGAQSIGGATGLVFAPTARLQADGTLAVGAGYVPETYSDYMEGRAYTPVYATLAFLPSVEVGFRFSRALGTGQPEALGDRMLFARVRVLEETGALPAVAVGAHDVLRSSSSLTNQFAALYAVASKRVGGAAFVESVDLHLGLGTDWIPARVHQFVGPFGGAEIALRDAETGVVRRIQTLVEYDGRSVNVGQRLGLGAGLDVTAAVQGFEAFTVGVVARRTL